MAEKFTKGEMHGCIVCGKLFQLYVVNDASGKFVAAIVMSAGGKIVSHASRALAACENHTDAETESAVARAYDVQNEDDD